MKCDFHRGQLYPAVWAIACGRLEDMSTRVVFACEFCGDAILKNGTVAEEDGTPYLFDELVRERI